jgi:hypothetical protein
MAIAACFAFQREISSSVLWDFFDSIGTNAKCRPHRATSEFGGKAENIYSRDIGSDPKPAGLRMLRNWYTPSKSR